MSMTRPDHFLNRRTLLRGAGGVATAALTASLASVGYAEGEPDSDAKKKPKKTVTPLSEAHQKVLREIPIDPPPEKLIQDQHFLVSDEHHPERFADVMRDLGGVYIGVGPEQNYLYAAWARPDIIILLDFDQMVVDIHELYRVFILAAAGPEEMIKLWSKQEKARALALIDAATSDEERRTHLRKVYVGSQRPIYNRLKSLATRYGAMKLDTFLSDADAYGFIRDMLSAGRVRAVRGDLTKDKAMNGVAKAAKALAVKVRCVYLSNVEQYFDYDNGLGDNLEAQPTDKSSKILRTVYKNESKFERYHYVAQRDDHFRAWLDTDVKNLRAMMEKAQKRIKKTKHTWILPGPT